MNNRKIGSRGEQKALELLEKKGYKLLKKNYNTKIGETKCILITRSI